MSKKPMRSAAIGTAMRTGDVKVPYVLKRNLFYPMMRGLKEHILQDGEVTIIGFGKFKIYPRIVKKAVIGPDTKRSYVLRFKPSPSLKKELVQRWSEKVGLVIAPSLQEVVPSVGGEASVALSAADVVAPGDTSTTTGTDW